MIDWPAVQTRLGVKADGYFGPVSYTALLSHIAGRAVDLAHGKAAALHIKFHAIDATPKRLAAFLGQCAHESGQFRYTREKWGPTADQKRYDAPGNTLGNLPGDGFPLRGAGPIEVTGRKNLTVIGKRIGKNLTGDPSILNDIEVGWLISLEWWDMNGMNLIADTRDTLAVSRAVNRGSPDSPRMPYGAAERQDYTDRALEVLS